jgi:hypothetical protein
MTLISDDPPNKTCLPRKIAFIKIEDYPPKIKHVQGKTILLLISYT